MQSLKTWLARDRILVVLNVPEAVEPDAIAALGREAVVVSPPKPQGYSANLNYGVAMLSSELDFCVLANDDVVFEHESLPRLVDVLRRDAGVGIVGPRLVNPDGSEAASYDRYPTLAEAIRRMTILPRPLWLAQERRRTRRAADDDAAIFVIGAAMVVRLASFRAVGGFDEDFFLNYEEMDFCYRLQRAGWRVAWCPEATVTHLQGTSISPELNVATLRAGRRLYFKKRLGPLRWLLLEVLLALAFGAGVVYSLVAALVRPRTARQRRELIRERWRYRLFLVS